MFYGIVMTGQECLCGQLQKCMGWDVTKLPILCSYLCVPMKQKISYLLKTAVAPLLESFYQHKMSMHQVRDSRHISFTVVIS